MDTSTADTHKDLNDFSIVRGGPFYRLLCSVRLCDDQFHYTFRRTVAIAAFTWLPLLVLSAFSGQAVSGIKIPFLNDIETHVRFLVALPLLLVGEGWAQRMLAQRLPNFLIRKIIGPADVPKFEGLIRSAYRMRDSVFVELTILIIVIALGSMSYAAIASASPDSYTWYARPDGAKWNVTYAGYWFVFISLPIFQFLLLRWYFRLLIWSIFLFRVSRLDLHLIGTHSDKTGGIGFIGKTVYAFSFFLAAQGALLSGYVAGKAFNMGASPLDFKVVAAFLVMMLIGVVLAPQFVFVNTLRRAKWNTEGVYGNLVSKYVGGFDEKWIGEVNPEDEPLLGTSDIQSLADISNGYSVITQMRLVPFTVTHVTFLAIFTVGPLVPLLLYVYSPEQLIEHLIKIIL